MLTRILTFLAVYQVVIAGFYSGTGVLELTSKNFKKEVLHNGNVSVVEFYAPWCPHCKNMVSQYAKSAKSLRGIARVGAVDCDDPQNKKLCATYQVQGFPTIKVFQPSKLTDVDFKDVNEGKPVPKRRPRIWDYQGPREYKAINSFAVSKLRNYAATLNSEKTIPWMKKNKVPRVVMMPGQKYKSKSVAPLFKVLSREYFGKIRFGYLPRRADGAWSLLGLKAPDESQLVYMSDDREPLVYKGAMKKKHIKKFIDEQYNFEMSRRARNGDQASADRDEAANGLEFIVEDKQEPEMEHMKERRKEIDQEAEYILEARREALERIGEDPSKIVPSKLSSVLVEPLPESTSTDDGSIFIPDFDDEEDESVDSTEEIDFPDGDAILDEIEDDLLPEDIVVEGENTAPQTTKSEPKVGNAPKPTPEIVIRENGLESMDEIIKHCLRQSGRSCVLLATYPDRKNDDIFTVQQSIQYLPREVRNKVIFHYTMPHTKDIETFLKSHGLDDPSQQSPGILYFAPAKRKFSTFDADFTAIDLAKFTVAGYDRRLEWQPYPKKYVYWVTEEEALMLKDEL